MLTVKVTVRIIFKHTVCDLDYLKYLQSALKSPPSTTGAAEDTVGGSLKTAENEVWLRCFRQWISGGICMITSMRMVLIMINTIENDVWLKCFTVWISGEKTWLLSW